MNEIITNENISELINIVIIQTWIIYIESL